MPGTADRIVYHESLSQRTAVVGAGAAEGENIVAAPHDEHSVGPNMANEHSGYRDVGEEDALREIRSRRLRVAHEEESNGSRQ